MGVLIVSYATTSCQMNTFFSTYRTFIERGLPSFAMSCIKHFCLFKKCHFSWIIIILDSLHCMGNISRDFFYFLLFMSSHFRGSFLKAFSIDTLPCKSLGSLSKKHTKLFCPYTLQRIQDYDSNDTLIYNFVRSNAEKISIIFSVFFEKCLNIVTHA